MREDELLAHIYDRSRGLAAMFPQVLVGPGHDCAVIALPAPGHALVKVDQVVEGRHFRAGAPLDLIARKAVARAASDIAAAGGRPVAALCAAILPTGYRHGDELFDAVSRWGQSFGCPMVGGDIAVGGTLSLALTAIGSPHPVRGPVLRSGVVAGDAVYVTGALGGSLDAATGLGRHMTFEPRVAEATWLCDTLGADLHAMMDVSDGLGRDAGRMAGASGVQIRIDAAAIPRSPGVLDWRRAASDGEDYELLFAAPAKAKLPARTPTGVPISRIGVAEAGGGVVIVDGGREFDGSAMGYEHHD